MKKTILLIIFTLLGAKSYSQQSFSNVELVGQKNQVLIAKSGDIYKTGKLSTGETIKVGCDHGACYIQIEYKGKMISKGIGDDISNLIIYEYDFGNDGDKEIIVVNEFSKTTFLYVFLYGRGLIQKLFDKEIMYYKTILKADYIEYYMPSGLDQVWNYYQGQFWAMTPIKMNDY